MNRPVSFAIAFPADFTLSVEEIWPDGDAPENPTAEDVVAQMRKSGGVSAVMRDWCLDPDRIEVFGNHDASKAELKGY